MPVSPQTVHIGGRIVAADLNLYHLLHRRHLSVVNVGGCDKCELAIVLEFLWFMQLRN
jgi:hypothetical protein